MAFQRSILIGSVLFAGACNWDAPPPPPPPPGAPGAPVAPTGTPNPATPAGSSNFGTITLRAGFTPDPHLARGTSGGDVQARNLHASCNGWVSSLPDHLFIAQGPFSTLRFLVNGGAADLTLVVQRPDGAYACNDDAEGHHPIVTGSFQAGVHKIWIGSYSEGVSAPYTLGISALSSVRAESLGAGGSGGSGGNLNSNFGTVSLTPGFSPDPHSVQGRSGGGIAARTLSPNCLGWVSQTPDHVLSAPQGFDYLRVLTRSTSDTTLVIQEPNGNYRCDDDTFNSNPSVAGSFAPGNYRIWVGSYSRDDGASYKIGFSEMQGTRPRNLR